MTRDGLAGRAADPGFAYAPSEMSAVARVMSASPLPLCANHDRSRVLGCVISAAARAESVDVVAWLRLDTPEEKRVGELVADGTYTGLSISSFVTTLNDEVTVTSLLPLELSVCAAPDVAGCYIDRFEYDDGRARPSTRRVVASASHIAPPAVAFVSRAMSDIPAGSISRDPAATTVPAAPLLAQLVGPALTPSAAAPSAAPPDLLAFEAFRADALAAGVTLAEYRQTIAALRTADAARISEKAAADEAEASRHAAAIVDMYQQYLPETARDESVEALGQTLRGAVGDPNVGRPTLAAFHAVMAAASSTREGSPSALNAQRDARLASYEDRLKEERQRTEAATTRAAALEAKIAEITATKAFAADPLATKAGHAPHSDPLSLAVQTAKRQRLEPPAPHAAVASASKPADVGAFEDSWSRFKMGRPPVTFQDVGTS